MFRWAWVWPSRAVEGALWVALWVVILVRYFSGRRLAVTLLWAVVFTGCLVVLTVEVLG